MQPRAILETALYARNLAECEAFYTNVLGLTVYTEFGNRHVFYKVGEGMFLLFNPDETQQVGPPVNGSIITAHGAYGAGHAAFRIHEAEIDAWRARLQKLGVAIESEVNWPGGGYSIYFRDPAGNSVELATPKLWGISEG
jgi:catechol 2,3-dioxygenase-like lactoylglutathione lyase family enzyme